MSLAPGTRLGPYEILAPIGAGGMGEVWKARDPRLDRIVAIKISSAHFSDRFEREARAVAALNHPHICQIYDVGPDYLVMEYIEGAPLNGPMPVDQALKYAAQICDALDAAHRKGIIHRDLKPANILVTKSGVKVLDFGLAKLGSDGQAAAPPPDATATMALTGKHEIVGTLHYMSPEQLQAHADGPGIDTRSDIFSFGVVLFEMITGKQAFPGSSPASVIGAIMERPAPSIAEVAPPTLDRALHRCLAKDPDERWQSVRDLKAELEWIASASATSPPAAATLKGSRLAAIAAFAVLAVAVILLLTWWRFRGQAAAEPISLHLALPAGQSFQQVDSPALAISPDGARIAYCASAPKGAPQLYVRELHSYQLTAISNSDGAESPFFSPDGRWIAFVQDRNLKKVSVSGGVPETLAVSYSGGDWASDGKIYFFPFNSGLSRLRASGGTPEKLNVRAGEMNEHFPHLLPGGKAVLATAWNLSAGSYDDAHVVGVRMATGERKALISGGFAARYVPPDHLVYARAGTLMAVRFDPAALETQGSPAPVVNDLLTVAQTGAAQFAVSDNGTLIYLSAPAQSPDNDLESIERDGSSHHFGLKPQQYQSPRFSPDGKQLALTVRQPNPQIWIYDLGRATLRQMTFGGGENEVPVWSPNGREIAYAANGRHQAVIFTVDASAPERVIANIPEHFHLLSWSPDGKLIALEKYVADNTEIWMIPVAGGQKPYRFLQSSHLSQPAFSPNGHLLAYNSRDSGSPQVFITDFPGPGETAQVSADGGLEPVWSRDGREVFYRYKDSLMRAAVSNGPTLSVGKPEALFTARFSRTPVAGPNYDIAPDKKRFVVVTSAKPSGAIQARVILNWASQLNK